LTGKGAGSYYRDIPMKPELERVRLSLGGSFTPAVRIFLWINGLTYLFLELVAQRGFVLQTLDGLDIQVPYARLLPQLLGLVPYSVTHDYAWWQPITYMFVHREFFHLLMNMLALWWFGADVERQWGTKAFLRYYFVTGIGAGLTSIAMGWNSMTPTIGASGAVFGLLLAFGVLFPNRVIYLYFVIPVKAKYCVLGFGALEFLALVAWSPGDGVNHIAHLGGMFFGLAWFAYYRYGLDVQSLWRRLKRRRMRRKLRLIRKNRDEDPFDQYSNRTIH